MSHIYTINGKSVDAEIAAVIVAASRWFDMKRPIGDSLAEHIANPHVNCHTDSERELATAVAAMRAMIADGGEQ